MKSIMDSTSGTSKFFKKELIIESDTLRNLDMTLVPLKRHRNQIYFNGIDVPYNMIDDKKTE